MDLHLEHLVWPRTAKEAVAVQLELAAGVETEDRLGPVRFVAGVDVGYDLRTGRSYAAVAVLGFPGLEPVESAWAVLPTEFPYVPGLLSFREIPVILAALERLRTTPDLVLCDGQGIAHQRRIGIASHLGVLTDLPTIGAAKSRLVGRYEEPGQYRGDRSPLVHRGEVVGAVLRTRDRVGPLFVSSGHRVGLDTAVRYTLACAPKYRLPETTRQAHGLAAKAKAAAIESQIFLPAPPEKG